MRYLTILLAALALGGLSQAQVSLDYWLWDANQLAPYQQCVAGFEAANPGITVRVSQTGWGDYWTALTTGFVAGTAPDVFTNHLQQYPTFVEMEQIVDIAPLVERDGVDVDIYLEGLADLWERDGARYGLPKDWDTIAIVYNKAMTEAAGISDDAMRTLTWNPEDGGSFQEVAARLTLDRNGNDALAPDFDPGNVVQHGYSFAYDGAGQGYGQTEWSHFAVSTGWAFNDGIWGSEYYYDDPRFIATIEWVAHLMRELRIMPNFSDISALGGNALFYAGQVAMLTDGSWMIAGHADQAPFEIGFAPLPMGPEGRKSMFNGLADSIWVGTPHQEEAWLLVKHLASPACQEIVGAAGVVFPAVPSAVDAALATFAERGLEVSAYTEQALDEDGTFLFPITDFAAEINSIMAAALDAVLLGQQSAEAALTRANQDVNALFR